jgi:hypothetical protein
MTTNTVFNLGPGTYMLSFWASGNERDSSTNELEADVAGFSFDVTLASTAPWAVHTFGFTVVSPTMSSLTFREIGRPGVAINDNIGILLDDVSLSSNASAVPEPASLVLFASGLLSLCLQRRRRTNR